MTLTRISPNGDPLHTDLELLRIENRELKKELHESQQLLQIAPAYFGFVSPTGEVLMMNDFSLKAIESTREALVGRPVWDCPWWKPVPESAELLKSAVFDAAKGVHLKFDTPYWTIQNGVGNVRWVALEVTPFHESDGSISQIAVTGVDITLRKLAQDAYKKSQDQLERAVTLSKIGFYDWDIQNDLLTSSERMKADWGLKGAVTLQEILQFLHPEDRARAEALVKESIAEHKPFLTEYRVNRPDGKMIWIEARGEITYNEQGSPIRFFGTTQDISERKKIEEALQQSKATIENERENFYTLFRQTPEMVCILAGPEHVFEFVNEAHVKALGFDATGMSVRKAQPESVEVHDILDNVYRTGKTAALREIPVTVTDRVRYFNLTYSAKRNSKGEINGIMILGNEVSDVVEARRILESSETELRRFLNAVPATLWSAVPNGTIDFLNSFWYEYTGQKPDSGPDATPWETSIHPDDYPGTRQQWTESFAQGKAIDLQFRLKHGKDGEFHWHRSRGSPLRDANGNVVRWAGYISDINDEKQAVDDLTSEREIRERFVATLTHDLRTPLTAARMSAQILLRRANDPTALQKTSTRIIDNIDRMDQMIRDLLDANRLKAGEKLFLEIEKCSLDRIANEVMDDLSTIYGDRFLLATEGKMEGYWSADGIRRILENLCNNAIKYGTPHTPITVSLTKNEAGVAINVHNVGNPIPEKDRPLLFAAYRRTGTAQKSGQKGWGLGLTLVKGIAEAHHGSVSVQSSENAGTVFTVSLPMDARVT